MQDDPEAEPEGSVEAAGAAGGGVPEVRQAAAAAGGAVWRVHRVLGLPEVQVCEAGDPGRAVPEVRRRCCRAEEPARRCVLRMHAVSEVRLYEQPEAGGGGLP